MNRYYFARRTEDGRLNIINTSEGRELPGYASKEDAKANARGLLRLRGSNKIVLVEVIEAIEVTANVKFAPFK